MPPIEPQEWTISGMDCAACATKIRSAVERLPGVSDVTVAVMAEKLSLKLDVAKTPRATVEATVTKLGYGIGGPKPARARNLVIRPAPAKIQDPADQDQDHDTPGHIHNDPADQGKHWYQTGKGKLVIGTGLLLAAAWLTKLFASEEIARWAFVAACLIGAAPVAKRAFAALRAGMPFTIEALMTIAAVGALFINAAEEAALVVFLFAVGEVLEGVAANKARNSIRALANLIPKTAIIEVGGVTEQIDAAALQIGQTVLVRPGDRIPADGTISNGTSGIDESPVTGESMPRTKGPGDPVFAGSINAEAVLRISVTRTAEDNTIARIIKLVAEAETSRAPTERIIERFSRIYMPAIVALALLVALVPTFGFGQDWDTWIYRALALLLIGCPCALVISVPAAIASALSAGAKRGLLMKGGAVIEAAAKTTRVAFDKTGTLTYGRPLVTDVIPLGADASVILSVAAAVEAGSNHPLAKAILLRAEADRIAILPSTDAKAIIGKGVVATVAGEQAWVASPNYAADEGALDAVGMANAAELERQGKTVVVVFRAKQPLGLIAMRDEPRPEAVEGIRQLAALGVTSIMLTGDNARTAAAIAGSLGMDHRADLMPADKVTEIKKFADAGGVMMVGDGINDAPALAASTVGIAMGSGTDVALETADAALLRNRVTDVAAQIRLARAAMSNIRQNVAVALGLKAVFLITSILGITGLWIAILADTGATVLVTLNAMRLLSFNPDREG